MQALAIFFNPAEWYSCRITEEKIVPEHIFLERQRIEPADIDVRSKTIGKAETRTRQIRKKLEDVEVLPMASGTATLLGPALILAETPEADVEEELEESHA